MTYEEFKQMLESASENINKTSRLIEFRGKQKNTKEWCFGFYTPAFNEKGEVFPAIASISIAELLYEPVIPETIGQYTGLTDKNGKKIFEGDIIKRDFTLWHGEKKKTRETQIGVVFYSDTDCGFNLKNACNLRKPWDGDTLKIIGNIHDNPELLKGGADQ